MIRKNKKDAYWINCDCVILAVIARKDIPITDTRKITALTNIEGKMPAMVELDLLAPLLFTNRYVAAAEPIQPPATNPMLADASAIMAPSTILSR